MLSTSEAYENLHIFEKELELFHLGMDQHTYSFLPLHIISIHAMSEHCQAYCGSGTCGGSHIVLDIALFEFWRWQAQFRGQFELKFSLILGLLQELELNV